MPTYEDRELGRVRRTILVVDDADVSREMLVSLLGNDYEIIEASDGREGIKVLEERADDLSAVLLDLYMPVVDGYAFLRFRQTDARYASVPVIVATSSDSIDDGMIRCLELGADDVVVKPYHGEVIRNRLSNTIRLRESASIVNQLKWDMTTGLYREEFFVNLVDDLLGNRPDQDFDMVVSDISNFKLLNDRYGRENCDALLRDMVRAFDSVIPAILAAGRVGDDSFGYLIEHRVGHPWVSSLKPAVDSLGIPQLSVRFGIVETVDHSLSATRLCDWARMAMEEVPGIGVEVAFYDDDLRRRHSLERELVETMEQGLADGQFVVYYQPKHDVRTGKVSGAEALVRWVHPKHGFLRPDVFVPLFERNRMIDKLDDFVCRQVCGEIARVERLGLPATPISVNISPLDFENADLVQRLVGMADREGIQHDLLHLELTETAYASNSKSVVTALKKLRSLGFRVELDDFGRGYSSLVLLNLLPLDIVKIDGSMVKNAVRLSDYRIVQSAIQIAQVLGLETVIEGVETYDALVRLSDMGCDQIQGFYFSWPLRREDFETYLEDNTSRSKALT